jgi:4-hydroxybenzoate polyprenyltransferase
MATAAQRRVSEGMPEPAPAVLLVEAEALLATDLATEAALALLRRRPLELVRWAVGLAPGPLEARAAAVSVAPDPELLPIDRDVIAFLEAERAAGRRLVLFSNGRPELLRALARRIGLFDVVLEPEETQPAVVVERFGQGFALLGKDGGDPALRGAARWLVLREDELPPRGADRPVLARIARPQPGVSPWLRALRLHQWAKNLLVLVPVVLAGPLATAGDFGRALLAFFVLGLLASAGYLVNDLLDLEADRRHPSKRERPFASGQLSLRSGLLAVPVLLAPAAILTVLLPRAFAVVAVGYLVLTLAYSLALKRIPLLDVVVLGGLFSLRVLAGAEVISTPLSYWLLTLSMFLFSSLAFVKRYAELDQLLRRGGSELADRGGYSTADLPLLLALGVSTGVAATLIFVVYLVAEQFPREIYTRPGWLWLVFPVLLLWLARVWRFALHGRMNQDPVLFALTDRASLAMGAAVLACLVAAW